jgi:hypothetical protein
VARFPSDAKLQYSLWDSHSLISNRHNRRPLPERKVALPFTSLVPQARMVEPYLHFPVYLEDIN